MTVQRPASSLVLTDGLGVKVYLPLLIWGYSERGQARAGVPVLGMLGLLTHCSFCIFFFFLYF